MAVDNIARALAAKALGSSAGSVTPEDLEKKYDKTGGAISGDVSIQGNLTVSGTTTTEKEKQLLIEENVIATNANKVDLKTLLSGLAINKNPTATYGIMYDPTDDAVKFGEGTLSDDNKFVFKEGEGYPLAIRSDSTNMKNNNIVYWNADKHRLETADFRYDDVAVTDKSNIFRGIYDSFNRIKLRDVPSDPYDAARMFDTTETIDVTDLDELPKEYRDKLSLMPWKFYLYENDIIYRYMITCIDSAVYQAWINTETDGVIIDYKELEIRFTDFRILRFMSNFEIPLTDHDNDFTETQTFEKAKVTSEPTEDTDVTRLKDLEPIYITLTGGYDGKLTADELAKVIKYPDRVILINQLTLTNTLWFTFNSYRKDTDRNKEYYVFSQCNIAQDYDYTLTFLTVTSAGGWSIYNSANLALRNSTNIFDTRQQFNHGISASGISYIESIKKNTNDSSILVPLPFVTNKSNYSLIEPSSYVIHNSEYIIFKNADHAVTFAPPGEVPYNYRAIFIIDKPSRSKPIFERIDFINGEPVINSDSYFIFELTYKSSTEAIATQLYPSPISNKADLVPTPATGTVLYGVPSTSTNGQPQAITAGDGIVIDAKADGSGAEVKVDPQKGYLELNDISIWTLPQRQPTGWKQITVGTGVSNTIAGRSGRVPTEFDWVTIAKEGSLDGAAARKIDVGRACEITGQPASATAGTLTEEQLKILGGGCTDNSTESSAAGNSYILFNKERYYPMSYGHQDGYRTYTNVDCENDNFTIKTITVTLSTGAWVLNTLTAAPKLYKHVVTPAGVGFSVIDYSTIPTPYTPEQMSKTYHLTCGYYPGGSRGPIVGPVEVSLDSASGMVGFNLKYLANSETGYTETTGSELMAVDSWTDTVTPL